MDLPENRETFPTSRTALYASEVVRRCGGNLWYSYCFSTVGDLYESGALKVSEKTTLSCKPKRLYKAISSAQEAGKASCIPLYIPQMYSLSPPTAHNTSFLLLWS